MGWTCSSGTGAAEKRLRTRSKVRFFEQRTCAPRTPPRRCGPCETRLGGRGHSATHSVHPGRSVRPTLWWMQSWRAGLPARHQKAEAPSFPRVDENGRIPTVGMREILSAGVSRRFVSRRVGAGVEESRYTRIPIRQSRGSLRLHRLLDSYGLGEVNWIARSHSPDDR